MPVTAIYLFGSYAYGTPGDQSDLDIYIVTPDKTKRKIEHLKAARRSFYRHVSSPVDLLVNYQDEFDNRSRNHFTLEYEVANRGVNLIAFQ
ncbi:MAG TPA: hypothetical protein DD727_09855 [Clostridiales bacterium]|nr:hypothetical protein [Clostridiales bacterium]